MSEFDSDSGSGSGRKGFVHDVMRRISSSAPRGDEPPEEHEPRERGSQRSYQDEVEDLHDAIRLFGGDSDEFRGRLDRLVAEFEALRRRYQLNP